MASLYETMRGMDTGKRQPGSVRIPSLDDLYREMNPGRQGGLAAREATQPAQRPKMAQPSPGGAPSPVGANLSVRPPTGAPQAPTGAGMAPAPQSPLSPPVAQQPISPAAGRLNAMGKPVQTGTIAPAPISPLTRSSSIRTPDVSDMKMPELDQSFLSQNAITGNQVSGDNISDLKPGEGGDNPLISDVNLDATSDSFLERPAADTDLMATDAAANDYMDTNNGYYKSQRAHGLSEFQARDKLIDWLGGAEGQAFGEGYDSVRHNGGSEEEALDEGLRRSAMTHIGQSGTTAADSSGQGKYTNGGNRDSGGKSGLDQYLPDRGTSGSGAGNVDADLAHAGQLADDEMETYLPQLEEQKAIALSQLKSAINQRVVPASALRDFERDWATRMDTLRSELVRENMGYIAAGTARDQAQQNIDLLVKQFGDAHAMNELQRQALAKQMQDPKWYEYVLQLVGNVAGGIAGGAGYGAGAGMAKRYFAPPPPQTNYVTENYLGDN